MTEKEEEVQPVVVPASPVVIPDDPKQDAEPPWADRTVKPSTLRKVERDDRDNSD